MITYHEKGDSEVLPSRGLHGAENGSDHGAADPHERDHHHEPADAEIEKKSQTSIPLISYQSLWKEFYLIVMRYCMLRSGLRD